MWDGWRPCAPTGAGGRRPSALDKACSVAWLLDTLRRKHIVPIIPDRIGQLRYPGSDRQPHRQRNLIERLVGKLKQFGRAASR